MNVTERIAEMTETQVREALAALVEAATADPEALTIDTEMIVEVLEIYGLNIYEE